MKKLKKQETNYTTFSIFFIIIAIIGIGYEIFTGFKLNPPPFVLFIIGLLYSILSKL